MKRLAILLALLLLGLGAAPAARAQITNDALLDSLQSSAFRFFWYEANPANGLIKDRDTPGSPCSIASLGFGLSAITVGIDHGWVSRSAGAGRVLTTLLTLWNGPQGSGTSGVMGYQGLFYHFLDMNTGYRTWTSELSTIDTALLLAGVLDCRQYFTGGDYTETTIRQLSDSIYRRVNWHFVALSGTGPIYMGWTPENGFAGFGYWGGYPSGTSYCEAGILYLLAIGSPTYPLTGAIWNGWWCKGYRWQTLYGYSLVPFGPLFGHQYTHCWIDFRSMQDTFMATHGSNYFENTRRATLAQRAYCAANPKHWAGYSDSLWGITASDDPGGYTEHGAPNDTVRSYTENGTIAPTAALSSFPFTPDESMTFARVMWNIFYAEMWSPYGFKDAFNYGLGWYDTDVIGIDQGPICLMIENYRTAAIWTRYMQHPDIQRAIQLAGFTAIAGAPNPARLPGPQLAVWGTPNPARGPVMLHVQIPAAGPARLTVYDVSGREVARPLDGETPAGEHALRFGGEGLPAGIYLYRLEWNGEARTGRLVRLR